MPLAPFLTPSRLARRALVAVLLLGSTALARRVVVASHQASIDGTIEHSLEVIASDDVCMKGCRYSSGNIAERRKVAGNVDSGLFYRWTYIDDTRDSRFFSRVRVRHTGDGAEVLIAVLTRESDEALIERLEKETGLVHEPLADSVTRRVVLSRSNMGVEVRMNARAEVSGLLELFPGRVQSGLRQSMQQLAQNFER